MLGKSSFLITISFSTVLLSKLLQICNLCDYVNGITQLVFAGRMSYAYLNSELNIHKHAHVFSLLKLLVQRDV